jgi:hypothetical protein
MNAATKGHAHLVEIAALQFEVAGALLQVLVAVERMYAPIVQGACHP